MRYNPEAINLDRNENKETRLALAGEVMQIMVELFKTAG